jgi:hypothetical protein
MVKRTFALWYFVTLSLWYLNLKMVEWLKRVGRVFVLKGQVISAQWQRLGYDDHIPIFSP